MSHEIIVEESNEEWVVRFLNLPPDSQINFLYRFYLEEEARLKLEKMVFGK